MTTAERAAFYAIAIPRPTRPCFHGVAGGCPYCRRLRELDGDGPDRGDTDPANRLGPDCL